MYPSSTEDFDEFSERRDWMVTHQIEGRGIKAFKVLAAMREVPRERFIPEKLREEAYYDGPLSIGHGQTISQPYTVAMMCDALNLTGTEKVLEIGTGSGYAACILSKLARQVHTIERIPELAQNADARIRQLGIMNVRVHVGDGSLGLPDEAPFNAIVVTAGGPSLPPAFQSQLADGGRIVMPIGPRHDQRMTRCTKRHGVLEQEDLGAFNFVPLIGADAWAE